jgi:hypothetical protein
MMGEGEESRGGGGGKSSRRRVLLESTRRIPHRGDVHHLAGLVQDVVEIERKVLAHL